MTYLGLDLGLEMNEKTRNSSGMMVARDGVEPPTPAFSGLRSCSLTIFSINNLTRKNGRFIVTIL
jgi:hypothetical protein